MHRDNSDRYEVQLAPSLAGRKRLGSYLVDAGLINRGQIEVALNDQKVTGMKFGEILVTRGWIKQQTVEYIMAKVVLPERQKVATDPHSAQAKAAPAPPSSRIKEDLHSSSVVGASPTTNIQASSTKPPGINTPQHRQPSQRSVAGIAVPSPRTPNTSQRHIPPITKPLPSIPSENDGVNWVG